MRAMGPIGFNLFMQPGDKTTQQMIRSMDRGLYITRFWYTRIVHPTECIVTGMTRDGVYMVVDGEIAYPVKNLRFTQSYVEALDNVVSVGDTTMMLTSDYGEMQYNVPALKIRDFNFTGSTV
jgi:predicted Zn-dependent protease